MEEKVIRKKKTEKNILMKFFHHGRSDEKFKQSSFPTILLERNDVILFYYFLQHFPCMRVNFCRWMYIKIISSTTDVAEEAACDSTYLKSIFALFLN